MLEIIKTTTFTGTAKIGEVAAKVFSATINTANPEDMSFNHYVVKYDLYKANRAAIGAEQSAFEDAAYTFQDQLIAEKAVQA
ncbi:MAG: hypothetical protein CVU87_09480 [Firmicutes bacterium HGW-Firmicutes-12]|jgi:hypothetical protein|nr:MAG: hypothetical protein CVU87_09480 [Firmicutes bacterium HGW-Firmicutes-12]